MPTAARSRVATCLLLAVAACVGACKRPYVLPMNPPTVDSQGVTFSWEGDAARWITVYRCDVDCPPVDTLPSYFEDDDPQPGVVVWKISGVGSPADGAGTIATPLKYGDAEHPSASVATPPQELVPGDYLVRVVTFEGVQMKAHVGTGWSTFTISAP